MSSINTTALEVLLNNPPSKCRHTFKVFPINRKNSLKKKEVEDIVRKIVKEELEHFKKELKEIL